MKTVKICSVLILTMLLCLWGCEKDQFISDELDREISYDAKKGGGGGKPGSGTDGITIRDLGAPAGTWSRANGIALIGGDIYVVGVAEALSGENHAFLWTEANGWQDLGYLHEEYPYSEAMDIGSNGIITGWSSSIIPPFFSNNAVTWSAQNPSAGPVSINPTSSVNSSAQVINTHGDIAGSRVDTCGYNGYGDCSPGSPGGTTSIWSAFLWQANGNYVDVGTLGGDSWVTGINDAGILTGYSEMHKGDFDLRAFVWQQGNFQILPGLENLWSRSYDMNGAGQIVGEFDTLSGMISSQSAIRGFISGPNESGVWETQKLPTLGKRTIAYAISESGYVTGTTWAQKPNPKGRNQFDIVPFLYRDDIGIFNLGAFNKGGRGDGFDIIENTQDIIIVVGSGDVQGSRHALMWTIDLCALIPGTCS
ncbi:MAG: hypothetical protein OEQ53_10600 [Saprospiraceae bacterium]|nr:hypothetical protein [Saprospiraceae bacterium]